jgi:polyisoprenoid-binding protein YceI
MRKGTMKIGAGISIALFGLTFASAVFAQHQTFTLDPAASTVRFSLAGTGHEVHGTFHVQTGAVGIDRGGSQISGSIVVSAASGDSGDDGRDKNMRNNVLDVSHFADVTFQPKSFTGTLAVAGDSTIQVSGVFTLHGTPHDITVPMDIHIEGAKLTAKGKFAVPYVKWGLKDPSVFILRVAKEVDIELSLAGSLTPTN